MGFGFFRTIWISLRAVNYTTQAFQDTIHGLTKLQQAQLRVKMDAARNMMAVGAMYVAMGGMALMVINRIMQSSELGQQVLGEFGDSVGKSMGKLGDSFARVMGPLLNIVAKILELATANPIITDLITRLMLFGTIILVVFGVYKLFSGAVAILNLQLTVNNLKLSSSQLHFNAYGIAVRGATGATMSLGMALGLVTAGFTIFTLLGSVIGRQSGAIVAGLMAITLAVIALAIALNVLSVGTLTAGQLGALAAGAGIAAGIMAYESTQSPEYQMGTRMLTKTGPIIGHRGEVVYNPENQLPTQINQGMGGGRPTSLRQNVTIDLSGSTIQTKADKEELMPMVKRELRNIVLAKE